VASGNRGDDCARRSKPRLPREILDPAEPAARATRLARCGQHPPCKSFRDEAVRWPSAAAAAAASATHRHKTAAVAARRAICRTRGKGCLYVAVVRVVQRAGPPTERLRMRSWKRVAGDCPAELSDRGLALMSCVAASFPFVVLSRSARTSDCLTPLWRTIAASSSGTPPHLLQSPVTQHSTATSPREGRPACWNADTNEQMEQCSTCCTWPLLQLTVPVHQERREPPPTALPQAAGSKAY
jgi:hypothetical protein